MHVREEVFAPVPHRQFVFTIPKRLRIYFRFNRELLGQLPKIAYELIREVYQAVLVRANWVTYDQETSHDFKSSSSSLAIRFSRVLI